MSRLEELDERIGRLEKEASGAGTRIKELEAYLTGIRAGGLAGMIDRELAELFEKNRSELRRAISKWDNR